MRPQVKQLIDLIESEDWEFRTDQIRDTGNTVGVRHFRPKGQPFPRLCIFGVQIDELTYLTFDEDESKYANRIFDNYTYWSKKTGNDIGMNKINELLKARKS